MPGKLGLHITELKNSKKGYILILISFCNTSSINQIILENLYKFFKAVHFIEIKKITFLKISVRAFISRIKNEIPLKAWWLNSLEVLEILRKNYLD